MVHCQFLTRFQSLFLSLLRIAAAYMFLQHGTAKVLGIPKVEMFDGLPLMSLFGIAGILEIVGGALLLVGLFTRPVAFLMSGMMAVAYFLVHAKTTPLVPFMNQGEAAALFSFIFLYISAAGGGCLALDNYLSKQKAKA